MRKYLKYLQLLLLLVICSVIPLSAQANSAKRDTLKLNLGYNPQSLDPHISSGTVESTVLRNLLQGLVQTSPDGVPVPGVAESWTSADDYKKWTFKLRKDAKWSDGSPVTAHDFVYSFRRLVDPKTASPYGSYLAQAGVQNAKEVSSGALPLDKLGVRAEDDYTFVVDLTTSIPYFVDMLVHTSVLPVKKEVVEKYGDKWMRKETFVGNGGYVLHDFVTNEFIKLKKNPHFWQATDKQIENIVYFMINSPIVAYNRYQANELDVVGVGYPSTLRVSAEKAFPKEFRTSDSFCTSYLSLNQEKISDVRVRKALQLAIDMETITKKVQAGTRVASYTLVPPALKNANFKQPEWVSWPTKKRLAEARRLLAEAGYSKQKPLKLKLLYQTSESSAALAIALSSMLKNNLGVELELSHHEWRAYLDILHRGDFEMTWAGWCPDYNEPSTFFNMLLSDSTNNNVRYKNPAYDEIVEKAMVAPNDEARHELYQQLETILDEDVPYIIIGYARSFSLRKPWVKGFKVNTFGNVALHFIHLD